GHEMAVHHVHVNVIGTGGQRRRHLFAQTSEVGRENGRGEVNLGHRFLGRGGSDGERGQTPYIPVPSSTNDTPLCYSPSACPSGGGPRWYARFRSRNE